MTFKTFFYSIILAGLSSCGHQPPPPPPPPVSVNVYTVKEGSAQYYNSYPATVTAVNQVEVRPQVAGYITGIFFKEGQYVEKGQKLYQIDQQQYRGAYEQAVAQLRSRKPTWIKFNRMPTVTRNWANRTPLPSKQYSTHRQTWSQEKNR
jgi:membrane fusion protein (multidrug efflux system)